MPRKFALKTQIWGVSKDTEHPHRTCGDDSPIIATRTYHSRGNAPSRFTSLPVGLKFSAITYPDVNSTANHLFLIAFTTCLRQ